MWWINLFYLLIYIVHVLGSSNLHYNYITKVQNHNLLSNCFVITILIPSYTLFSSTPLSNRYSLLLDCLPYPHCPFLNTNTFIYYVSSNANYLNHATPKSHLSYPSTPPNVLPFISFLRFGHHSVNEYHHHRC